jgi:D-amino-acid oxidase
MADVIVLGGGIIGLTAAARLLDRGLSVRVWAEHDPLDTVSAVAAAAWYPTRTGYDPRVLSWAAATYEAFRRQHRDGVPGVLLRATRNLERTAGDEPWWAPAAGEVSYAAAAPPWVREVRFTAPMVEMTTYLPWLRDRLRERGAGFERRHAASLSEALADTPVVVNATGLAAGLLAEDPQIHPVRGQIVIAENPGLSTSVRVEGDPSTYVHPRSGDVVLGGTFQVGDDNLAPDPALRDAIVARCTALVPELGDVRVLGEKVGLRPARHGGPRVEAERRDGGTVVHAYGHGGAGMTLSWGCADEVARLVP